MVRETRHLKFSNVSESVSEDSFRSFLNENCGRVQKVEFIRTNGKTVQSAVVSFMDIRTASKVVDSRLSLEGLVLRAEYHEPGASHNSAVIEIHDSKATPGFGSRYASSNSNPSTSARGPDRPSPRIPRSSSRHSGRPRRRSRSSDSSRGSESSSRSPPSGKRGVKPAGAAIGSERTGGGQRKVEAKPLPVLIVRNLPSRSIDQSIKDGLYHKYKKCGKVVSVKVCGDKDERYGVVQFRRFCDVEKLLESQSRGNEEMFLGSRITVELATPLIDLSVDDNERKPLLRDFDELSLNSSRTLYIGNLENRSLTKDLLRGMFGDFGEILDVDIKNVNTPCPFAFIQFADVTSVVRAIHKMDSEYMGGNKIKCGFGKSLATHVVWFGDLPECLTQSHLSRKMNFYGVATDSVIDHFAHQALVYFDSIEVASSAVADMKKRKICNKRVQVDFASRELQDLFLDRMDRLNHHLTYPPQEDYYLSPGHPHPHPYDHPIIDPFIERLYTLQVDFASRELQDLFLDRMDRLNHHLTYPPQEDYYLSPGHPHPHPYDHPIIDPFIERLYTLQVDFASRELQDLFLDRMDRLNHHLTYPPQEDYYLSPGHPHPHPYDHPIIDPFIERLYTLQVDFASRELQDLFLDRMDRLNHHLTYPPQEDYYLSPGHPHPHPYDHPIIDPFIERLYTLQVDFASRELQDLFLDRMDRLNHHLTYPPQEDYYLSPGHPHPHPYDHPIIDPFIERLYTLQVDFASRELQDLFLDRMDRLNHHLTYPPQEDYYLSPGHPHPHPYYHPIIDPFIERLYTLQVDFASRELQDLFLDRMDRLNHHLTYPPQEDYYLSPGHPHPHPYDHPIIDPFIERLYTLQVDFASRELQDLFLDRMDRLNHHLTYPPQEDYYLSPGHPHPHPYDHPIIDPFIERLYTLQVDFASRELQDLFLDRMDRLNHHLTYPPQEDYYLSPGHPHPHPYDHPIIDPFIERLYTLQVDFASRELQDLFLDRMDRLNHHLTYPPQEDYYLSPGHPHPHPYDHPIIDPFIERFDRIDRYDRLKRYSREHSRENSSRYEYRDFPEDYHREREREPYKESAHSSRANSERGGNYSPEEARQGYGRTRRRSRSPERQSPRERPSNNASRMSRSAARSSAAEVRRSASRRSRSGYRSISPPVKAVSTSRITSPAVDHDRSRPDEFYGPRRPPSQSPPPSLEPPRPESSKAAAPEPLVKKSIPDTEPKKQLRKREEGPMKRGSSTSSDSDSSSTTSGDESSSTSDADSLRAAPSRKRKSPQKPKRPDAPVPMLAKTIPAENTTPFGPVEPPNLKQEVDEAEDRSIPDLLKEKQNLLKLLESLPEEGEVDSEGGSSSKDKKMKISDVFDLKWQKMAKKEALAKSISAGAAPSTPPSAQVPVKLETPPKSVLPEVHRLPLIKTELVPTVTSPSFISPTMSNEEVSERTDFSAADGPLAPVPKPVPPPDPVNSSRLSTGSWRVPPMAALPTDASVETALSQILKSPQSEEAISTEFKKRKRPQIKMRGDSDEGARSDSSNAPLGSVLTPKTVKTEESTLTNVLISGQVASAPPMGKPHDRFSFPPSGPRKIPASPDEDDRVTDPRLSKPPGSPISHDLPVPPFGAKFLTEKRDRSKMMAKLNDIAEMKKMQGEVEDKRKLLLSRLRNQRNGLDDIDSDSIDISPIERLSLEIPETISSSEISPGALSHSPNKGNAHSSLEERIKALDEKFNVLEKAVQAAKSNELVPKHSYSSATNSAVTTPTTPSASHSVDYTKFTIRRKPNIGILSTCAISPSLPVPPLTSPMGEDRTQGYHVSVFTPQPSETLPFSSSTLSRAALRSTIFDQDSERLANVDSKFTPGIYRPHPTQPSDHVGVPVPGSTETDYPHSTPAPSDIPPSEQSFDTRVSGFQPKRPAVLPRPNPAISPVTPLSSQAPGQRRLSVVTTGHAVIETTAISPFPISPPPVHGILKKPKYHASFSVPATPVENRDPTVDLPTSAPAVPSEPRTTRDPRAASAAAIPSASLLSMPSTEAPCRAHPPHFPETPRRYPANRIPADSSPLTSKSFKSLERATDKSFGLKHKPFKPSTEPKLEDPPAKSKEAEAVPSAPKELDRKVKKKEDEEKLQQKVHKKRSDKPETISPSKKTDGGKEKREKDEKEKKLKECNRKKDEKTKEKDEKVKEKDDKTKEKDEKVKEKDEKAKEKDEKLKERDGKVKEKVEKPKEKDKAKTSPKKPLSKKRSRKSDDSTESAGDSGSEQSKTALDKEWAEVLAVLEDEPVGLSMYDRVKRRSSTVKGDATDRKADLLMKDKFSKLKEKRGGKRRRVVSESSSSEDGEADHSDADGEKEQAAKKGLGKKPKIRIEDVFSSDEETSAAASRQERQTERHGPISDEEQRPPPGRPYLTKKKPSAVRSPPVEEKSDKPKERGKKRVLSEPTKRDDEGFESDESAGKPQKKKKATGKKKEKEGKKMTKGDEKEKTGKKEKRSEEAQEKPKSNRTRSSDAEKESQSKICTKAAAKQASDPGVSQEVKTIDNETVSADIIEALQRSASEAAAMDMDIPVEVAEVIVTENGSLRTVDGEEIDFVVTEECIEEDQSARSPAQPVPASTDASEQPEVLEEPKVTKVEPLEASAPVKTESPPAEPTVTEEPMPEPKLSSPVSLTPKNEEIVPDVPTPSISALKTEEVPSQQQVSLPEQGVEAKPEPVIPPTPTPTEVRVEAPMPFGSTENRDAAAAVPISSFTVPLAQTPTTPAGAFDYLFLPTMTPMEPSAASIENKIKDDHMDKVIDDVVHGFTEVNTSELKVHESSHHPPKRGAGRRSSAAASYDKDHLLSVVSQVASGLTSPDVVKEPQKSRASLSQGVIVPAAQVRPSSAAPVSDPHHHPVSTPSIGALPGSAFTAVPPASSTPTPNSRPESNPAGTPTTLPLQMDLLRLMAYPMASAYDLSGVSALAAQKQVAGMESAYGSAPYANLLRLSGVSTTATSPTPTPSYTSYASGFDARTLMELQKKQLWGTGYTGLTLPASAARQEDLLATERGLAHVRPGDSAAPSTFKALVQKYPIMWQGNLALKNDTSLVQMHFVSGNRHLPAQSLPVAKAKEASAEPSPAILRIAQRMRLEPEQLDGVGKRMELPDEHCILLALPCGRDQVDIFKQSRQLQQAFISYLQHKQAAGIVNVCAPETQVPQYVVHVFPPCEFAISSLTAVADDFYRSVKERDTPYLFVVVATV